MSKIHNSHFNKLIGTWKTSGQIIAGDKTELLSGRDTYEFILNGNYILHKAAVMMGDKKSETFEVIGLDDSTHSGVMHYFNSNGERGKMTSRINENEFTINGAGIKFSGSFNEANTMIEGRWYIQDRENAWKEYIVLKLEKQV